MSEKVDFIVVKITQILVEHSEEMFEHSTNILQKKLCEYLLISHAKSFLNIPPVNILYTNVEIKTLPGFTHYN